MALNLFYILGYFAAYYLISGIVMIVSTVGCARIRSKRNRIKYKTTEAYDFSRDVLEMDDLAHISNTILPVIPDKQTV